MKNITTTTELNEIINKEFTGLIKFSAPWCSPCKTLDKVLDEVIVESDIQIVKVDVDNSPELASQYNVMSIPKMVFIRNGEIINESVGVKQKQEILDFFK